MSETHQLHEPAPDFEKQALSDVVLSLTGQNVELRALWLSARAEIERLKRDE